MFGKTSTNRNGAPDAEMRAIRDAAQRESYAYNDPRAHYPTAEQFRRARAEGAALAQEPAA
jgi:hypothetical protein